MIIPGNRDILISVKTSITLSDDLWLALKRIALDKGKTLSEVIEEYLRQCVSAS